MFPQITGWHCPDAAAGREVVTALVTCDLRVLAVRARVVGDGLLVDFDLGYAAAVFRLRRGLRIRR